MSQTPLNFQEISAKFEELRAMMAAIGAQVPPSVSAEAMRDMSVGERVSRPKIEDITDLVPAPNEDANPSNTTGDVAAPAEFVNEVVAESTSETPAVEASSAAEVEPVPVPNNPLRLYTYDEIRRYLLYKYGAVEYSIQVPSGTVAFNLDSPIQFIIANKIVAIAQLRGTGNIVRTNTGEICMTLLFSNFVEPPVQE